jgi:hypothetical protein
VFTSEALSLTFSIERRKMRLKLAVAEKKREVFFFAVCFFSHLEIPETREKKDDICYLPAL